MVAISSTPVERLSVSKVIVMAFRLIGRRPIQLVGFAVLLALLPAAAQVWATAHFQTGPTPGSPDYWNGLLRSIASLEVIGFAAAGVNWVFQGAVALCAMGEATGNRAWMSRLPSRAASLLTTGLLSNLGVLLGTIAFLIPGVLLGLAWCAAPAVTAVEDRGLLTALRRSADLTRGNRPEIFGFLLLFGVARYAAFYGARFAFAGRSVLQPTTGPAWLVYVVQPAISACFSIIYAAALASAYLELRRIKEGSATGGVAAVFD
jgi:hypothetical protein